VNELEEFNKCTVKQKHRCGRAVIGCKLGLWGVESPTYNAAMREAMHYFRQYRSDGEYSSILGGESVIEKLTK